MATHSCPWSSYTGEEIMSMPGLTNGVGQPDTAQSRVDVAVVSSGTGTIAVPVLDVELRFDATYTFEYNLIYSVSGLAVGAQFGVQSANQPFLSIGYSVMIAADGSSLRSSPTATAGVMIGSGSSFSGGGPWSCTIKGALKTGSTRDNIARLLMRGQGVGVTLTLQPNSSAFFMEV